MLKNQIKQIPIIWCAKHSKHSKTFQKIRDSLMLLNSPWLSHGEMKMMRLWWWWWLGGNGDDGCDNGDDDDDGNGDIQTFTYQNSSVKT